MYQEKERENSLLDVSTGGQKEYIKKIKESIYSSQNSIIKFVNLKTSRKTTKNQSNPRPVEIKPEKIVGSPKGL